MDISLWGIASILIVLKGGATAAHQEDILEWYRPSQGNPPELNSFLTNVWRHKNDFSLIENLAKNYQKSKKSYNSIKDWDIVADDDAFDPASKLQSNERYIRRVGGTASKKNKNPRQRVRRNLLTSVVLKPRSSSGVLYTNEESPPYDRLIKHRQEYENHYDDYDRAPSFQFDDVVYQPDENYHQKNQQRVVNDLNRGFIEVVKNRPRPTEKIFMENDVNNVYNDELFGKSNPLKHRIKKRKKHQLRIGRSLQFYGDMDYDDDDYQARSRRDFLEALGMKNEDDYSEDNNYAEKSTIEGNITSAIANVSTKRSPSSTKSSFISNDDDDKETTIDDEDETKPPPPESVDIPHIEPSAVKKREEGDLSIEDFNDVVEKNRDTRDIFDEINGSNKTDQKFHFDSNLIKHFSFDPTKNLNHPKIHKRHHKRKRKKKRKPNQERRKKDDFSDIINNNNNASSLEFEPYTLPSEAPFVITSEESNQVLATMMDNSLVTFDVNSQYNNNGSANKPAADEANLPNEDSERLARIIDGEVALNIVNSVINQVKDNAALKKQIFPVLIRKHPNYSGALNFQIIKSNDTSDDVIEAKILLKQISQVLNKIIWTQVNKKLCQHIPDELRQFLTTITDVDGDVDLENQIDMNTEQGDFLFDYQPYPNKGVSNQNDLKSTLEDLLKQFDQMNQDCRGKAQPLRDYITQHLKMLQQLGYCNNGGKCLGQDEVKRDTPPLVYRSDLIEQQLESLGLGKKHTFRPNFDINEIIESRLEPPPFSPRRDYKPYNMDTIISNDLESMKLKREIGNEESEKYRRLEKAVEQLREKRTTDEKIARLFGENAHHQQQQQQDRSDLETPIVYSL